MYCPNLVQNMIARITPKKYISPFSFFSIQNEIESQWKIVGFCDFCHFCDLIELILKHTDTIDVIYGGAPVEQNEYLFKPFLGMKEFKKLIFPKNAKNIPKI